jgi:predicted unusual protein kinase regulating ubiquinone biosynthesis (AarF/ABC1/UbiB family)
MLMDFRVAVKLQHPSLAEWIPLDMQLTRFSFEYIKWFFPEYPLTWLSDEMEASWVYLFRCGPFLGRDAYE